MATLIRKTAGSEVEVIDRNAPIWITAWPQVQYNFLFRFSRMRELREMLLGKGVSSRLTRGSIMDSVASRRGSQESTADARNSIALDIMKVREEMAASGQSEESDTEDENEDEAENIADAPDEPDNNDNQDTPNPINATANGSTEELVSTRGAHMSSGPLLSEAARKAQAKITQDDSFIHRNSKNAAVAPPPLPVFPVVKKAATEESKVTSQSRMSQASVSATTKQKLRRQSDLTFHAHSGKALFGQNVPGESRRASNRRRQHLGVAVPQDDPDMRIVWRMHTIWDNDPVRRVVNTNAYRLFLVLYLVTFYVCVVFGRWGSPVLTAVMAFGLVPAAMGSSRLDRKTFFLLTVQFEWWYILGHTMLFFAMGIWGMIGLVDPELIASTFIVLSFANYFSVMLDCNTMQNPVSRIFFLSVGVVVYLRLLIVDRWFTPDLEAHTVCIVFCTDSRRFAYIGCLQLIYYYGKYILRTFLSRHRVLQEFVMITAPVSARLAEYEITHGHRSSQADVQDTVTTDAQKVVSVIVSVGFTKYWDRDLVRPVDENALIKREFLFHPLLHWEFATRVARSKPYLILAGLYAVSLMAMVISTLDQDDIVGWVWVAPSLLFVVCELTRFDRSLCVGIVSRFEFYVVVFAAIQYMIFGLWSHVKDDAASDIPHAVPYFLLWWLVALLAICGDAAPSYPWWMRMTVVCLLLINSIVLFILDGVSTRTFQENRVCFLFCSDTRVIAFSALFTTSLFFLKYFVHMILNPGKCSVLSCNVAYSISNHRPAFLDAPTGIGRSKRGSEAGGGGPNLLRAHTAMATTGTYVDLKPLKVKQTRKSIALDLRRQESLANMKGLPKQAVASST